MRKVAEWFKYFFMILGAFVGTAAVIGGVVYGCMTLFREFGPPAALGLMLIGLAAWGATANVRDN